MSWPPDYLVRKSPRAKYVQLKITPEKGLEVILPYRAGHVDINNLLLKHQQWIEKKLSQISLLSKRLILPVCLDLSAIEEKWTINSLKSTDKLQLLARPDYSLMLLGDVTDLKSSLEKIKTWLQKRAKNTLIPWARSLSKQTGLEANKFSIRSQRTRWGSCSQEGNISLNHKLLFLPYNLANYVIIHELCHLKHLNHSKRFWHLVQQHDPNFLEHRRHLSHLSQQIGDFGKGPHPQSK